MKHYKMKQFCRYMGVTPDTVKHYQQCGILSPITDETNNYRYYNITHGERLIVSRKFRNLGFSIDETKAMISQKNGLQIAEMLKEKKKSLSTEMQRLNSMEENLNYLESLCNLFNEKAGTVIKGVRPAYYVYRHTFDFEFLEDNTYESNVKELMESLPNVVKMMVIPYDTLIRRKNEGYYHCLSIRELDSSKINSELKKTMEYHEESPALIYLYSRPHCHDKFEFLHDIYLKLESEGYHLSKDNILIENAIDYYENGIRYENYLVYYSYL